MNTSVPGGPPPPPFNTSDSDPNGTFWPPPWQSPPPAEPPPESPPIPSPDPLAILVGIRNVVSDRAITNGLWIDVVVGAIFIILFSLCQSRVKTYRARLNLLSVAVPPPELPSRGWKQYWYWLWAVLATPEVDLLASAGLDALMMVKIVELGIQLFIPLTLFGVAVLLPVHFHGKGLKQTQANTSQMMKLTVSNLDDGSDLLWLHFVLVYLYLGYMMMLLRYRYFEYVKLRQHYLSKGDDHNYWRQCYVPLEKANIKKSMINALQKLKRAFQPIGTGVDVEKGGFDDLASITTDLEASNRGRTAATAPNTPRGGRAGAEQTLELVNRLEPPKPSPLGNGTAAALPSPGRSPAQLGSLQVEVEAEAEGRRELRRSVSADAALLNGRTAPPLLMRLQDSLEASARTLANGSRTGMSIHMTHGAGMSGSCTGTRTELKASHHRRARSTDDHTSLLGRGLTRLKSSGEDGELDAAGGVSWTRWWDNMDVTVEAEDEDLAGQPSTSAAALPQPRISTTGGALGRASVTLAPAPSAGAMARQILAKPSIRYKKTVNTVDKDGRKVAVNAQQYTVLVTDVQDPIYPEMVETARHPLYKLNLLLRKTLPRWLSKYIFLFYQPDNPVYDAALMKHGVFGPARRTQDDVGYRAPGDNSTLPSRYAVLSYSSSDSEEVPENTILATSESVVGMEKSPSMPSIAAASERASKSRWSKVRKALRNGDLLKLPQDVVTRTFKALFPNDFVRAIPVFKHEEVDKRLWDWDKAYKGWETAKAYHSMFGKRQRVRLSRWSTDSVDAMDYYRTQVSELEKAVKSARKRALERAFTPSWFVFFRTQTAATIASSTLLHSEDNYKFQVYAAPGPEDINWKTLWLDHRQREFRSMCTLPFIIIIVLFPIGSFAGGLSMLDVSLCATAPTNSARWDWYCKQESDAAKWFKHFLVGLLPSILLNLYQNMVMPRILYYLAQSEGSALSLSALDRRIGGLYFYWDIFNVFLGGILGASIVGQIDQARTRPGIVIDLLGVALPSASNFFIAYIVFRSFVIMPFRLFGPHPGLWIFFLKKGLSIFGPQLLSARDRIEMQTPRSPRYGFEIGLMMLVFLIGISYSVVAPLLMPFTLIFFLMAYVFWRYILLYVYIRKYESGGIMWPYVFNRLCVCMVIFQFFTSCVLVVKRAYWQAAILWLTVPLIVLKFWRYCRTTFQVGVDGNPLELAMRAPQALVDPWVYIAPPLHEKLMGWYPEYMKAWDGWGAPY